MADRDELQSGEEDDGGGAVKSFLEHLEDLRWTLIKGAAAIFVGMLVCLFGVKTVVAILKWPLARAQNRHVAFIPEDTNQIVTIKLSECHALNTFNASSNRLGAPRSWEPIDTSIPCNLSPLTGEWNLMF